MILAGDIGGTKTVLALFEPDGKNLKTSPRGNLSRARPTRRSRRS